MVSQLQDLRCVLIHQVVALLNEYIHYTSEYNKYGTKVVRKKTKVTVIFKSGQFDNIDTAVIISSVSKAVQD